MNITNKRTVNIINKTCIKNILYLKTVPKTFKTTHPSFPNFETISDTHNG